MVTTATAKQTSQVNAQLTSITLSAWVLTLAVSALPDVIAREVLHGDGWLPGIKFAVLVAAFALTLLTTRFRPLRSYSAILLILTTAEWGAWYAGQTSGWKQLFGSGPVDSKLSSQVLRFAVTLLLIVVLFLLKRKRQDFFLATSERDSMAQPVWWLPIKKPERWSRVAPWIGFVIGLGTLAFLVIAGRPSREFFNAVLKLLPWVLAFACLNAFSEEMSYRASLIAVLEKAVGQGQAIWLAAAYFGLAHYYGVPYGTVGVLMAGFLALILGKIMVETRGVLWPWFIHFVQDVLIFSFMLAGSVVPGGR